jgi:arylformamidase
LSRFDGAWLDRMYNNRALVPDFAAYFERWGTLSAAARTQACVLDVPYGAAALERLDVFPAATDSPAPVMVFVHGGYWRALDKSDHSFLAPAFTSQGVCVVLPNYSLCPAVTVADIVLQMVQSLVWTWRNVAAYGADPRRITVVGHSAGGHLAAQMLNAIWPQVSADLPANLVRNALSISGLFDLEPIMHAPFLRDSLQLTPEQVARVSPAWQPAPKGRVLNAVAGGDESPEFKRQNKLIRKAWGAKVVPVEESLPGLNHFSVLDALIDPAHRLHHLAMALLRAP